MNNRNAVRRWCASTLVGVSLLSIPALGQAPPSTPSWNAPGGSAIPTGTLVVSRAQEKLDMVINTSQILETDSEISRAVVQNDKAVQVRPIGPNQLMVSARATGVAQVDIYGPDNSVRNVQILVLGDARELEIILSTQFPTANLRVRPINNGCILTGTVTSDIDVEKANSIAELYYPTVINTINVVGVHTIMLHTQVMEVSRTKLRELGIDWGFGLGDDLISQTVSGTGNALATSAANIASTGTETFKFGIVNNGNQYFQLLRALRQNNLVKVVANPTVVALDGRPASFNSGGEFPIVVPAGLGQVGIEFREFGTRLDFVGKVRSDGKIQLEVRPTISEIDPSRSVTISGISVPGLRSRFVDTAVELRAGQTLALAGLLQVRTETQSVGLPFFADLPYLGTFFRANREVQNEVELLILVTPDFAGPMEACEVPPGGPGYNSGSPTDREFYLRGFIEVPPGCGGATCTGCPSCSPHLNPNGQGVLNQGSSNGGPMNGSMIMDGQTRGTNAPMQQNSSMIPVNPVSYSGTMRGAANSRR